MTKATGTHSEHVILIVFPMQQWLYIGASMFRCTYRACFVHKSLFKDTNTYMSIKFVLKLKVRREDVE